MVRVATLKDVVATHILLPAFNTEASDALTVR
jgi:hypothetical protein